MVRLSPRSHGRLGKRMRSGRCCTQLMSAAVSGLVAAPASEPPTSIVCKHLLGL